MKSLGYFLVAVALWWLMHEYCHVVFSVLFNEYETTTWHIYGPEVLYSTPVAERTPHLKWFFISGGSNFLTLALGYVLFFSRNKIHKIKNVNIKNLLFYMGVVFLLADAINLSIGPFIAGGDAHGIAVGLKTKPWIIQVIFGIVLLINRELAVGFMRSLGIKSNHFLFKSFLQ